MVAMIDPGVWNTVGVHSALDALVRAAKAARTAKTEIETLAELRKAKELIAYIEERRENYRWPPGAPPATRERPPAGPPLVEVREDGGRSWWWPF
jgi:hypothetical protein